MKCTDCHRQLKPVIAIDIDGTLGAYHRHFLEFALNWIGWLGSGEDHPYDWYKYDGSVDMATHMGVNKDVYRRIKLAYRQGGMKRTMPLLEHTAPSVPELVNGLREVAEVWITTSRPYNRLDNVDPDTVEWLRRNGITYDGLLYDDMKMTALMEIVGKGRIVGVLDDLPSVYDIAESFGLQPILMSSWHNRAVHRPVKVASMLLAASMLRVRAERWSQR